MLQIIGQLQTAACKDRGCALAVAGGLCCPLYMAARQCCAVGGRSRAAGLRAVEPLACSRRQLPVEMTGRAQAAAGEGFLGIHVVLDTGLQANMLQVEDA